MKLRTVRVRRSRPSVLSLALALMITMFFVYLASLSIAPRETASTAAAREASSAEVRMEALDRAFSCSGRYDTLLEARIKAAQCAQEGGAGMILSDGSRFAVINEAISANDADKDAILRSAAGITLKMEGPAGEIAAVSDAAAFLRAQATETGSLAAALEGGDTDASSICALLNVYRTQGQRVLSVLREIESPDAVVTRLISASEAALARIESVLAQPDSGKIKLIHAAACAEWISMLNDFAGETP